MRNEVYPNCKSFWKKIYLYETTILAPTVPLPQDSFHHLRKPRTAFGGGDVARQMAQAASYRADICHADAVAKVLEHGHIVARVADKGPAFQFRFQLAAQQLLGDPLGTLPFGELAKAAVDVDAADGGVHAFGVQDVQHLGYLRRRILRAFVGRSLLESFEAKEMLAYKHSGFSVDAGVCIEAHDRAALGKDVPRVIPQGNVLPPTHEPAPPAKRSPAHYLWAVLIARIYEVFPLLCPMCGGQMRLIAFITEGTQIRKILDHIGVDSEPPHISPARGPPLWDDCDAQTDEGAQNEPADWVLAAQPAPDFEVDQRINW